MTESKSEATDRLRRENRWSEASKFKDEAIAAERRGGKSRQDAAAAGWAAMLEKFPPIPSESFVEFPLDPATDNLADSSPSKFVSDAWWVYNQLGKTTIDPAAAPSAGAWALMRWARRNEDRFFEVMLPKALQLGVKLDTQLADEDSLNRENLEYLKSLDELMGWTDP